MEIKTHHDTEILGISITRGNCLLRNNQTRLIESLFSFAGDFIINKINVCESYLVYLIQVQR